MGYKGVVVTDALNMGAVTGQYSSAEAAVKALQAGADLLLMPENFRQAYQGVLDAVADGRLTEERIDESVKRILALKIPMNIS
jgi:beta-N-acetylhexosaminidase